MSGFKPTNSSKLRHSTSVDSQDSSSSEKPPSRRRVSLPFRKDIMSKGGDSEDSGPAINKSVLRASTGGINAKNLRLSTETLPTSKRQRISPAGDYVSTGDDAQSATNKSSNWSLIVKLRYRGGAAVQNEAPAFQDSDVYVTGQGLEGQMATPMRKTHKGVPVHVDSLDPLDGTSVVQMACGPTHCAALTSDGSIRTWGSNALGALGRDTGRPDTTDNWCYSLEQMYVPMDETAATNKGPQVDIESIPEEVNMKAFLDGVAIVQVAVGCHKTFALTTDGYVYAWGAFVYHFHRDIKVDLTVHKEPTLVIGLRNITRIAAGNDFLLALNDAAEVQRLGVFTYDADVGEIDWFHTHPWNELWPHNRPHSTRPRIASIHATPMSAFGIDRKGILWSWGDHRSNKLGHAESRESRFPQKVRGLTDFKVKTVVGSPRLTLVVTVDGAAYIWGSLEDAFPQAAKWDLPAGIETEENEAERRTIITKPVRLPFGNVTSAAVGDEHMVIVVDEDKVYSWGSNRAGQCGLGWSRSSLSIPYEMRIKNLEPREVKWVAAAGTWTFFGVPVEGAGRGITNSVLPKRSTEDMDVT